MFTEGFFNSIYNDWTCYALPLAVLILALVCLRQWPIRRRIGASLLFAIAVFVFFFFGSLSWFLRDGLKVGMMSSYRTEAVRRFISQDFIAIVVVTLLLASGGVFLLLKQRTTHPHTNG